jgi:hypothetical protein
MVLTLPKCHEFLALVINVSEEGTIFNAQGHL